MFKDMKLTNKLIDSEQKSEKMGDKHVSKITICGRTEDICKLKIVNAVR